MRATRFAVVMLTGLSLAACGDDDDDTKTYTIGALVGLTGNNADIAYGETVQLAADQVNAALKAEGEDFRIKLILQDSQAVPEVAMERGLDAVQNQGARALLFDTSQDVVTAAKSYYDDDTSNDLGVVLMDGLGSGASIINPDGLPWQADADHWIWRTVMSSNVPAYSAIDVLATYTPAGNIAGDVNGDGVVKIAMFGTNDGLGQPLLAAAKAHAELLFGEDVVVERSYHDAGLSVDSTADWTNFVTKLLDANDDDVDLNANTTTSVPGHVPDVIFTGLQVLYNVPTYKAYVASGSTTPIMGSLAMRSSVFLTEVGAQAEGAQSVGFAQYAPTASGDQMQADFQAATGGTGGTSILYDAYVTLSLAAIIAAHSTGDIDTVGNDEMKASLPLTSVAGGVQANAGIDGLRLAIRTIRDGGSINYDGASGPCDFDENGDVRSYVARNVVQGGVWVSPETYDCTTSLTECVLIQ